MKAFTLETFDGPDGLVLTDVPDPLPGPDEVLVDVRAVGINFPDLLATRGQYQHKPELPFVPGCEIAGTIAGAPAGSSFSPGDDVSAFVWNGGYAERAVVPVRSLARLPAGADHATGAGMIVNYHTVHFALARRGGVRAGDVVLVLGAGGGIGSAGVQVAKGLGATVVAGVADENQRATAESSGADAVVLLEEGFAGEVRALGDGRGVDVVLDPVGDWLFIEATRALRPEGRILVVGFAAGGIPELKVNRLLLGNISAVGVGWGAFLEEDADLMPWGARALDAMYAAGHVRPAIGAQLAFEEIPAALRQLERGAIAGKAIALV